MQLVINIILFLETINKGDFQVFKTKWIISQWYGRHVVTAHKLNKSEADNSYTVGFSLVQLRAS